MARRAARVAPPQVKEPIRLVPEDAARYVKLRRRMLVDSPWAFSADPEDDPASDVSRVAAELGKEDDAILAIAEGPELVAALGVARRRGAKFAHRALIWSVFVDSAHRRQGHGAALLARAIELAKGWPGIDYIDLSVSAGSPEAKALYERFGFRAWGTEPEATQVRGRRYDEHHMTLRLRL